MTASKPYSLAQRLFLGLLAGMLFLSGSAFAPSQGRTPDPFAKQLPLGGLKDLVPPAEVPADKLTAPNIVRDISFEASYGSETYWQQDSVNYGTPLCTVADCGSGSGTAGPRSGAVWAWFGGVDFSDPNASSPEVAYVSQLVRIPSCGGVLKFYLWIGSATPGSGTDDKFVVDLNSTRIFTATATQRGSYPSYQLVTINITPAMIANSNEQVLLFGSFVSDQLVTFNLDNVTLTPNCLVISGTTGLQGTTLTYTGGSTTAGAFGNYSFNVPVGWSGTVMPSLAHYTFTPAQRTYSNLAANLSGQNYTGSPIMHSISGNTGVGGATVTYSGSSGTWNIRSQSNGAYSFSERETWSGTVTPSHPCFTFTPAFRSYADNLVNRTGQDYTPTFDAGSGCADVKADIGGLNRGRFGLLPGESSGANFSGLDSGPVKLYSTNAVPLVSSERVIYKVNNVNTSFTEMLALPNSQLDNIYWLPWYNNVNLDTQLRIANVGGATASVDVYIGGVLRTPTPISLAPGASTRQSFAGVDAGPVKIVSTQDIVAAERVIYTVNNVRTSFSEMMALPNSQLTNTYWLPWYNNVNLDSQLRFANVTDQPATVTITIGGVLQAPINLAAGESTRVSYAGVDNGPVQIVSTQNIVAAERIIYKLGNVPTSFTELMALPNSLLDNTYWMPWYNNLTLDSQLRFANVSVATATVHVYIGGTEVTSPSGLTLAPGQSTRVSFSGVNNGPVQIVSDQNIVAAERVIYRVNSTPTSYSEMMGLPESLLDTAYWLPWYNNVNLDTQIRFGMP